MQYKTVIKFYQKRLGILIQQFRIRLEIYQNVEQLSCCKQLLMVLIFQGLHCLNRRGTLEVVILKFSYGSVNFKQYRFYALIQARFRKFDIWHIYNQHQILLNKNSFSTIKLLPYGFSLFPQRKLRTLTNRGLTFHLFVFIESSLFFTQYFKKTRINYNYNKKTRTSISRN